MDNKLYEMMDWAAVEGLYIQKKIIRTIFWGHM